MTTCRDASRSDPKESWLYPKVKQSDKFAAIWSTPTQDEESFVLIPGLVLCSAGVVFLNPSISTYPQHGPE